MEVLDIITGCDSGIGYSLTEIYIKKHKPVIISYVDKNPFQGSSFVWGIKMDLRDEEQIVSFAKEALHIIEKNKMKLGTLFDNSGVALGGSIENTPINIYREVMEVNFFGLISLTQKFIPKLISSKGRILIHGSMGGRVSLPFLSPYSSSKFALEALTDSLRRELTSFGVQVSLLETGGVATPIWLKAEKQDISFIHKRYENGVKSFLNSFVGSAKVSLKTEIASKKIYKMIHKNRLPYRYRVSGNPIKNYLPIIIPTRLLDWIFKRMLKM